MPPEYRFLRFEIAGLATVILYTLMTWPIASKSITNMEIQNLGATFAGVAALLLFAAPLGYFEHEIVVNQYRSEKRPRKIHELLSNMIDEEAQRQSKTNPLARLDNRDRNAVLTTLAELLLFCKDMNVDVGIFDRLSDRWSHFYARKAVGLYSPTLAGLLWLVTLAGGFFLGWRVSRWWISVILWAVFAIAAFLFIHQYSKKILSEISNLEVEIMIMNEKKGEEHDLRVRSLAQHGLSGDGYTNSRIPTYVESSFGCEAAFKSWMAAFLSS